MKTRLLAFFSLPLILLAGSTYGRWLSERDAAGLATYGIRPECQR